MGLSMKTATLHHQYQPDSFAFTPENQDKITEIFARYPEGRQKSAVMPLLDLAQRQVAEQGPYGPYAIGGGWIPRAAMDEIARLINVAPIKVYEVATFYSMYNLHPVGKYLVQICTTTPCQLGGCGAMVILETCRTHLGIGIDETTPDGLFTIKDVECLGACVNAPMVQINDDYYEDLTPDSIKHVLDELRAGRTPPKGSQTGRKGSCPCTGPTALKDMVKGA
jgi:NADH dehydrogenase (ubiquinone) flavoprotein 2